MDKNASGTWLLDLEGDPEWLAGYRSLELEIGEVLLVTLASPRDNKFATPEWRAAQSLRVRLRFSDPAERQHHSVRMKQAMASVHTNYNARRLTSDQVQQIRARRKAGETLMALAKAFKVSHVTIHRCCAHTIYRDVP